MLNSLLPAKTNSFIKTNVGTPVGAGWFAITMYTILLLLLITSVVLLVVYRDDVNNGWNTAVELIKSYYEKPTPTPTPMPSFTPSSMPLPNTVPLPQNQTQSIVEKVLPGGKEVFNISSNKFTYYDAEPLCSALGAELATYDQVKEAWSKGADWCNYGWVKGQMALYPTSGDTFKKMQSGPEEGRGSCGQVGVNGGYFDNPELKYGVTCYGKKPPQTSHSAADVSKNTPTSPSALAYEQKVHEFKAISDSIGILPFNNTSWSS